jgi:hypothetical protein
MSDDTESRLLKAANYNAGYALADACKEIDALSAEVKHLTEALIKIEFIDLKPFEKELFRGSDKLKRMAYEALR